MKTFTVIFLGFIVGIIASHYIISSNESRKNVNKRDTTEIVLQTEQKDPIEEKNITYKTYRRWGDVHSINYDENFILLSLLNEYQREFVYIIKIFFDERTTIKERNRYYIDDVIYFTKLAPFVKNIKAIQAGDRIIVRFDKTKEGSFKAQDMELINIIKK